MSVGATIGVEYAVGLGRRRAVVLRTGLDWSMWAGAPVQAGIGVEVRWLAPPTTTHPGEQAADTVEVVHINDVRIPWLEHLAREEGRQAAREAVERMTAEVYAAIGWDGEQLPGVVEVRMPLYLVHAALTGSRDA